MYDIVEKYIYDQLKKENRKLVFSDVREDMVKLIINTMDLGDIYSERLAFIALFNICCKFTTRSSVIDFTWNTFSLKNTK